MINVHPLRLRTLLIPTCLLACLAACAPTPEAALAPTDFPQPKQLATIYLTATPDDSQRVATDAANVNATAAARATAAIVFAATSSVPTATAYVGVFIPPPENDAPIVDETIYEGTRIAQLPTPTLFPCEIPPDPAFGVGWLEDAQLVRRLGCPGEPATPYPGTAQVFERGVMYAIPTGEVWGIAPDTSGGEAWYYANAVADVPLAIDIPAGFRQPDGAFRVFWRVESRLREAIGFTRADVADVQILYQRFDGGAFLYDVSSAQGFIMLGTGLSNPREAYGPY